MSPVERRGTGSLRTLLPRSPRRMALPALLAGAFSLGVLLSACSVGPNYVKPETEVSDQWKAAVTAELSAEEPDLQQWWTAFDDTLLTSLIVQAGENNKNLKVAVERIREARAIRGVSKADFFPQVNANGAYTRRQLSENALGNLEAPVGGIPPTNVWDLGFDASWEIDLFGRVRRQVEAATAEVEASVEDYRDVMVSLYAEVARNYVELRTLQERLAFARQNAKAQTESLDITRTRFETGLTSALDVAQAEANLSGTLSSIPPLETRLTAAFNRLAVLMGEQPGALEDELKDPAPIPRPTHDLATGVPANALRRRPDVRRAERQLAAQTARIGVATADFFPRLSLPGFIGWRSNDTGNLFNAGSLMWQFMPQFRWNIFSAGKVKNRVRAERARTEQALLNYEQSILLALEEVENTMTAYYQEQQRHQHLQDAVTAAERSVELVRTQYLSGLTNFQNLLDSQRTLFRRQDELSASSGKVVKDLIALNKALGGGWSYNAPVPGLSDDGDETEVSQAGGAVPSDPSPTVPPAGKVGE